MDGWLREKEVWLRRWDHRYRDTLVHENAASVSPTYALTLFLPSMFTLEVRIFSGGGTKKSYALTLFLPSIFTLSFFAGPDQMILQ